VKRVAKLHIFGDEINRQANQLVNRWEDKRFSPEPFDDDMDEMVEEEGEDSSEISDTEAQPPAAASSGQLHDQVNAKVQELLRGILVTRSAKRRDYKLDPGFPKRPADTFGHNGLSVGEWWPFQSFSLRDGAHGAKMGGIYGKLSRGAYSVVISGGIYDDNDRDIGTRILYSGSKGDQEEASIVPPLTNATKTLILSTKHRQPVRVLRASKANSKWAPSIGIRYDGLYDVDSYTIQKDAGGKQFYQFVLLRQQGQPPIDMSRPTKLEIAAYHKIRS